MSKKVVAVLFGGQSSEHEVSKISAATVISALSSDKYYVMPIYITLDGRWMMYEGSVENITNGQWEKYATRVILSPDTEHRGLLRIVGDKIKNIHVDVVFPVLHGKGGEDGTVQGLLELSGIPYVGCGVLSSSVSMDKSYTKLIAKGLGIEQAKYKVIKKYEFENNENISDEIEKELKYPIFVKPSNAGSSVGISKASDKNELKEALKLAFEHDRTVIAEETVYGREVECAVLGNDEPKASCVGEILAAADFYDFDAKYNNKDSKTVVPADLPEEISDKIKENAVKVFKAVDGKGLSRVDFFVEKDTNRVIFNEINTLPGFTSISMYPMLWENEGIEIDELVDTLIELAFEKSEEDER